MVSQAVAFTPDGCHGLRRVFSRASARICGRQLRAVDATSDTTLGFLPLVSVVRQSQQLWPLVMAYTRTDAYCGIDIVGLMSRPLANLRFVDRPRRPRRNVRGTAIWSVSTGAADGRWVASAVA